MLCVNTFDRLMKTNPREDFEQGTKTRKNIQPHALFSCCEIRIGTCNLTFVTT